MFTWCLVGGGRQPLAEALVRAILEEEVEGTGDSRSPRGFRGPPGASRRDSARQHSIAIVYITSLLMEGNPASENDLLAEVTGFAVNFSLFFFLFQATCCYHMCTLTFFAI